MNSCYSLDFGLDQLLQKVYSKFVDTFTSFNFLLHSKKKWSWSTDCSKAFQNAKNQLTSASVLTHFKPTLPNTLAADASAHTVGTVISLMVQKPLLLAH